MSNANSATQAPHTEEDVPMDLSDSGGMQSPQTKVNDDVEFSDSSLASFPVLQIIIPWICVMLTSYHRQNLQMPI